MDVIFLDVDGVLISESSFWKVQLCRGQTIFFEAKALLALKELVQATGAKIIITSSWRTPPGKAPTRSWLHLQSVLAHNGTPVAGQTPHLADGVLDRSDEIAAWLAEHPTERYVIFDDNNRFCNHPDIAAHWIPVSTRRGLSAEDCGRALPLLQSSHN